MRNSLKKLLSAAALLSSVLLTSCAKQSTPQEPAETAMPKDSEPSPAVEATVNEPLQEEKNTDRKILVVYFSRTGEQYGVSVIDKGNTEIVAEMIAEETGADLYEVVPEEDTYPLTYKELTDVAKQEQNDNARPAYAKTVPDLSGYDTVFIGAPVWWGDWPMILYTFFENENLSEKTLIPFSTHAGSGLSGFDGKLAKACPDSTVLEGLAVSGADAQKNPEGVKEKVTQWISGLNY